MRGKVIKAASGERVELNKGGAPGHVLTIYTNDGWSRDNLGAVVLTRAQARQVRDYIDRWLKSRKGNSNER